MSGRIVGTGPQMVIDGGTLIRHASPVPGGLRGPCVRPKEIHLHTLVFSGEMLHRFFRSVARSIVLARRIKLRPMRADPKDDLGVRAIIKMTPDRFLPEEVDLPTEEQIDAEVEPESNQFGEQFWQELDKRGVQGVLTYLEDLQAQRENALAKYQDTFRELSRHNEGAEATTPSSNSAPPLSSPACRCQWSQPPPQEQASRQGARSQPSGSAPDTQSA